jgi:hypothetical protein
VSKKYGTIESSAKDSPMNLDHLANTSAQDLQTIETQKGPLSGISKKREEVNEYGSDLQKFKTADRTAKLTLGIKFKQDEETSLRVKPESDYFDSIEYRDISRHSKNGHKQASQVDSFQQEMTGNTDSLRIQDLLIESRAFN